MSNRSEHGQALPEYLVGLAGVLLAFWAGQQLFQDALDSSWNALCFWIRFPNP